MELPGVGPMVPTTVQYGRTQRGDTQRRVRSRGVKLTQQQAGMWGGRLDA